MQPGAGFGLHRRRQTHPAPSPSPSPFGAAPETRAELEAERDALQAECSSLLQRLRSLQATTSSSKRAGSAGSNASSSSAAAAASPSPSGAAPASTPPAARRRSRMASDEGGEGGTDATSAAAAPPPSFQPPPPPPQPPQDNSPRALAEAAKRRGNDLFSLKKFEQAADAYSRGLEARSGDAKLDAVLHCNRAAALSALGRHVDAVADCCAAEALDAAYLRPRARRAEALAALGDAAAASAELEALARLGVPGAADRLASLTAGRGNGAGGGPSGAGSGSSWEGVAASLLPPSGRGTGGNPASAALQQQQPDPYLVLGLARGASAAEVKTAYRRLALRFHPDKAAGVPGGEAASRLLFGTVSAAAATLSDPLKRAAVDARARAAAARAAASHQPYPSSSSSRASHHAPPPPPARPWNDWRPSASQSPSPPPPGASAWRGP